MCRGGWDTSLGHVLALEWLNLDLLCLVLAQQPPILPESITTEQQTCAPGCLKNTATTKSKLANKKQGEQWACGHLAVIHSGLRLLHTQVSLEQTSFKTSFKTSSSKTVQFKKEKKKPNQNYAAETGKRHSHVNRSQGMGSRGAGRTQAAVGVRRRCPRCCSLSAAMEKGHIPKQPRQFC